MQRAEETADLIADCLPGVPVGASGLLGDDLPPVSSQPGPAAALRRVAEQLSPDERSEGAELASAAIERYARPGGRDDSELIVTHNFLIGWFVRHALDAPDWRWMGLNQCNGGITVILYRTGMPASLVSFNDIGHLPAPRALDRVPGRDNPAAALSTRPAMPG